MKVKYKLITIIAVALMGIVVVGGIGIYNAIEDGKSLREIDTTRIPKIQELGELQVVMTDLVRRSYEILSKNDLTYEEQVLELKRIHDRLAEVVKGGPELIQKFGSRPIAAEGKPTWDRFIALWSGWFEYDKIAYAMLDKAIASPSQEAFNAIYSQIRKGNMVRQAQTTEIREALEQLVAINSKLSSEAVEAAINGSDRAIWEQVIIAFVVFVVLLFLSWSSITAIIKPLNKFKDLLGSVADEHDLTQRMNYHATDEIGEMSTAFDHTMDALQEAFRDIRQQIESVAHSVEALAATAKQVAASSQSQSSSSSAMAASVEEMAVSINTVSASATDAKQMAQEAGKVSDEGGQIVEETSSEMTVIARSVGEASQVIQKLGENSTEISNVVQVIREVADQTNLLALNAAIEAARAGEQGRGFAVVADEVRKLAERTAQSTGDISTMIGKIQASASDAVEKMDKVVKQMESGQQHAQEAGKRIQSIRVETGKVSEAMVEISNALKEQGEASNDIARHVESIAQITDENNAAAEETSSNAQRLDELARNVQNTINQFKV
ncbi:MAG: methyl-accepting chemotaxis protein [Azoarcus sp.]|jgi:methyl-accepting chemotaxis protein|nr:methyl-accepting chemotaxis protein [Azoarcus sp.]